MVLLSVSIRLPQIVEIVSGLSVFPKAMDHATLNLKLPSDRTCISVISRSRSLHLEAQSTQVRSHATPL